MPRSLLRGSLLLEKNKDEKITVNAVGFPTEIEKKIVNRSKPCNGCDDIQHAMYIASGELNLTSVIQKYKSGPQQVDIFSHSVHVSPGQSGALIWTYSKNGNQRNYCGIGIHAYGSENYDKNGEPRNRCVRINYPHLINIQKWVENGNLQ